MQDQVTQQPTEDEGRLHSLELKMEELRTRRDSVVAELKDTTRERDMVYATVEARRAIDAMTDSQKTAMQQILGVHSVAPTNVVSSPDKIK